MIIMKIGFNRKSSNTVNGEKIPNFPASMCDTPRDDAPNDVMFHNFRLLTLTKHQSNVVNL